MSKTQTFRNSLLATGTALMLVLSGCATSTRLEPAAPVEDRSAGTQSGSTSTTTPGGGNGTTSQTRESKVETLDLGKGTDIGLGNAGLPRIVYFDFDSYVVKDTHRQVIESNAKYLGVDRKRQMLIEGHTDERGGREYNLALGQRRAEAVVRALALLGVPESQTEAVSYGEERPSVSGNDEAAWAKNRRAELKDR
jgi:peptidoglycan-associated lipoprotein